MEPKIRLKPRVSSGGKVINNRDDHWHLEIPAGSNRGYRLAQLDDYETLPRADFMWKPPLSISISARACSNNIPGTWGFGLWNDPAGISLGIQGGNRKIPCLPNAAWYFIASKPNFLSIYNHLPGYGNLAGVFQSPQTPGVFLSPALAFLPFLWIKPLSRLLRKTARKFIKQDTSLFQVDLTKWHSYHILWDSSWVKLIVDDDLILHTSVSPSSPMGTVIWIDNQFAGWDPQGKIAFGTLENPQPTWIEIKYLEYKHMQKAFS